MGKVRERLRWQSALGPGACGSSLSGFGCGLAMFLQRSGDRVSSRVEERETNVIKNMVILLYLKKRRKQKERGKRVKNSAPVHGGGVATTG